MNFPRDFIDRVREANNLVEVVGRHVQLRRTGSHFQGLCPFHREKSPSFSVSEDKQVYHCFGCKASGNVYSFVQNLQGLTFPETVEYLARRAGLSLPAEAAPRNERAADQKTTLFKVNAHAARFFHEQLAKAGDRHPAKAYLAGRGVTDELILNHRLGYAPDDWTALTRIFEATRVPLSAAEQLGLIKRRAGGKSGHYDLFRHRLIFPIFSPTGQCLGFGGRVLDSDQQPKYLNSPDSPVFHKGTVFYGLDHSAKFIRQEDEAIVVEGYMDWLALVKVNIHHAVATLGTALTADHARLIKRYTGRILLLFDGDEAGKAAARRSLPILLGAGLLVRGLFLPEGMDPDDFVRSRGETPLRELIRSAPDLFDLVAAESWLAHQSSATGRVQVLDELAPILEATVDPRLRQLYARNLANLLDVDSRMIEQSLARLKNSDSIRIQQPPANPKVEAPHAPSGSSEARKIDLTRISRVEAELLNLILLKEVFLKESLAAGVGDMLAHSGARALYRRIAELYGQMPNKFDNLSALLTDEVNNVEVITRHLSEDYARLDDEGAHKFLRDCIQRVRENNLRLQSRELVKSLRGGNVATANEKLEQIMNVQRSRRSLKHGSENPEN